MCVCVRVCEGEGEGGLADTHTHTHTETSACTPLPDLVAILVQGQVDKLVAPEVCVCAQLSKVDLKVNDDEGTGVEVLWGLHTTVCAVSNNRVSVGLHGAPR